MNLPLRKIFCVALALFLGFITAGCSKKGGELQVAKQSLLQELPPAAYGFYYLDTTTSAFKEAQKGAWGLKSQKGYLAALEGNPALESMKSYLSILEKAKLFDFDNEKAAPFKELLGFVSKDDVLPIAAGMYLSAASGVSMSEMLADMRSLLSAENITAKDETFDGASGFSLDVSKLSTSPQGDGAPPAPVREVFVASSKDRLALGTSRTIVQRAFNPSAEKGFAALEASERYKKAFSALSSRKSEMAIAYIDVRGFVDAFAAFMPPSADANSVQNMPLESVAISVGMTPDLTTSVAIPVAPKTPEQERWLKVVSASASRGILDRMPSNLVLLLSLDGGVVGEAKKLALEKAPPEARAEIENSLKIFDSLKNVTLAFRNAVGGTSPFPELLIGAEADDAAGAVTTIKDLISGSIKQSGAPMGADWLTKDVGGHQVSYIMSPMGIGVFMTSVDKSLIVASSEAAVQAFVGAGKGGAASFISGLEKSGKDLLESRNSPIVFYLGFKQLYDLLSGVQSTLAMFTGGKAAMDAAQFEHLKSKGELLVALSYDKSILRLELVQGKAAVS